MRAWPGRLSSPGAVFVVAMAPTLPQRWDCPSLGAWMRAPPRRRQGRSLWTKLGCPCRCQLRASVLRNGGVEPGGYVHLPSCMMSPGALPTPPPSKGGAVPPAEGVRRRAGRPSSGRGCAEPAAWTGIAQADSRLAETDRNRRRDYDAATSNRQPAHHKRPPSRTNTTRSSLHRRPTGPYRPHHVPASPPDQPPPALRVASTVHPRLSTSSLIPGPLLA